MKCEATECEVALLSVPLLLDQFDNIKLEIWHATDYVKYDIQHDVVVAGVWIGEMWLESLESNS